MGYDTGNEKYRESFEGKYVDLKSKERGWEDKIKMDFPNMACEDWKWL